MPGKTRMHSIEGFGKTDMQTEPAVNRNRIKRLNLFLYLFLGVSTVVALFPIYWMVLTALKPVDEIFVYPPTFFPSRLAFENFVEAWNTAPFGRYFINTIIITGLTVASHIALACLTAYAFVTIRFPGRNLLFLVFLGTMMVPSVVTLVPTFVLIKKLNWINTFRGLVIPHMVSVFGIFLLRQFFLTVPKDYEDAARIDGCGRFGILWQMYIPLAKPAIAALAIFSFYHVWNEFFWPLVITSTNDMRTLSVGLRFFIDTEGGSDWELVMAGSTFVVAPVLLAFFLLQRQFVRGITMTGLKG
jgi:ABC-type glycerol-3-phosphate transport system permease component